MPTLLNAVFGFPAWAGSWCSQNKGHKERRESFVFINLGAKAIHANCVNPLRPILTPWKLPAFPIGEQERQAQLFMSISLCLYIVVCYIVLMVQSYNFFLNLQSFLSILLQILPLQPHLYPPLLAVVGVDLLVAGAEGVSICVGGDAVFDADVPVGGDVVASHQIAAVPLVLIRHAVVLVDEVALHGV